MKLGKHFFPHDGILSQKGLMQAGVGGSMAMSSLTHENHIKERAFPNLLGNTPGHQILSLCSSVMKQMV